MRELSEVTEIFCILTWAVTMQVDTFIKPHQTVRFNVCKLRSTFKIIKRKKEKTVQKSIRLQWIKGIHYISIHYSYFLMFADIGKLRIMFLRFSWIQESKTKLLQIRCTHARFAKEQANRGEGEAIFLLFDVAEGQWGGGQWKGISWPGQVSLWPKPDSPFHGWSQAACIWRGGQNREKLRVTSLFWFLFHCVLLWIFTSIHNSCKYHVTTAQIATT